MSLIRIIIFVSLLLLPLTLPAQRVMPPEVLTCDRNDLTSFTGVVERYKRESGTIELRVATDDGTHEAFQFILGENKQWPARFLINGAEFSESDWDSIEISEGHLRSGMRVIIWVCLDGATRPVVDWRPTDEESS